MISLGLVYPKAKRPESGVSCGGSNALQSIKSNLKELLAFQNALSRRQRDVFDATLDQIFEAFEKDVLSRHARNEFL